MIYKSKLEEAKVICFQLEKLVEGIGCEHVKIARKRLRDCKCHLENAIIKCNQAEKIEAEKQKKIEEAKAKSEAEKK